MSRTRRGSTSSRSSANSVPPPVPSRPPPLPPIPVEHRRLTRVPEAQNGESLAVPKARPTRWSRGVSVPGSSRQPGGLAPIEESQGVHSQYSPPPIPARSSVQGGGVPIAPWLEQVEFHQQASRQLAQSVSPRSRAPSAPAPAPPKYSLFPPPHTRPVALAPPPRLVSSASVTPSDMSRASSPGWLNEFSQPGNHPLFVVSAPSNTNNHSSPSPRPRPGQPVRLPSPASLL
jgi:hypothetical protein